MRFIPFFLLFIFLAAPAWAVVRVSAELSGQRTLVGEPLQLQLKVSGHQGEVEIAQPKLANLEFRQIGSPSRSTQISTINGQTTRFEGLIYNFALLAYRPGNYDIGPIRVKIGGEIYLTGEISFIATDPDQNQGKEVVKLTLALNKSQVYVGEEARVILSWKLLEDVEKYDLYLPLVNEKGVDLKLVPAEPGANQVNLNLGRFKVPFIQESEQQGADSWTILRRGFMFYPKEEGVIHIEPARVTTMTVQGYTNQRDFFGRNLRTPKLKRHFARTQALNLKVIPLPLEGRPPEFSGAIGQYQLSLASQFAQVEVNDPIEVTLRLSGQGALKGLVPPSLTPWKENFKVEDWSLPEEIDRALVFHTKIRPRQAGQSEIPPLAYPYFDPEKKAYRWAKTNPIPLEVGQEKRLDLSSLKPHQVSPEKTMQPMGGRDGEGSATGFGWADLALFGLAPLLCLLAWLLHLYQSNRPETLPGPDWEALARNLQEAQEKVNQSEEFYALLWGIMEDGGLEEARSRLEDRRFTPGEPSREVKEEDWQWFSRQLSIRSAKRAAP